MKKDYLKATINSITDPGVILNLGGARLSYATSPETAAINIMTSGLCFAVRSTAELKKIGVNIPVPKLFNKLVENEGNAMIASGVVTIGSAAAAIPNIDLSTPETLIPPVFMTVIGSSNVLRGAASAFENGSIKQRLMDFGGIATAVGAFLFTNADGPALIQAGFVLSGIMATYLVMKNKMSGGLMQPDQTFAATCFANAAITPDPAFKVANILWGTGSLTLDMMKKHGGVYEAISHHFKRKHI